MTVLHGTCPTCGAAVRIVGGGTLHYEPEASISELATIAFADAERVEQARLLAEKWKHSSDVDERRQGADLAQVLGP